MPVRGQRDVFGESGLRSPWTLRGRRNGTEDRPSGQRRLNKTLRDELRIYRSNHAVTRLAVGQHRSSPSIAANHFLRGNPFTAKRVIVKLRLGLRDNPEEGAAGEK